MKQYKLIYLPIFKNDIKDITRYIAVDLNNKKAAHQLTDDILKTIELLKNSPEMYQEYHFIKSLKKKYRYFVVKNYIVFYTVDKKKKEVTIYRALYKKRNLENIIR